jgi:hypothetical protein
MGAFFLERKKILQNEILKNHIEANKARYRGSYGVNPFFTLSNDGAKRLSAFLKSRNLDIIKQGAVPLAIMNDFMREAGVPQPQSSRAISALLGGVSEGYNSQYVNIDPIVLAGLAEEAQRGR